MMNVKLPMVTLLTFAGQSTSQWMDFGNCFDAAIHMQDSLPAALKFTELRGLLKGIAAGIVLGFAVDEESHTEAIKFLKEPFWNKAAQKVLCIRNGSLTLFCIKQAYVLEATFQFNKEDFPPAACTKH